MQYAHELVRIWLVRGGHEGKWGWVGGFIPITVPLDFSSYSCPEADESTAFHADVLFITDGHIQAFRLKLVGHQNL